MNTGQEKRESKHGKENAKANKLKEKRNWKQEKEYKVNQRSKTGVLSVTLLALAFEKYFTLWTNVFKTKTKLPKWEKITLYYVQIGVLR